MKEMAEVDVRVPTRRGGPSDAARFGRRSSVRAAASNMGTRRPHLTRGVVVVVVIISDSSAHV